MDGSGNQINTSLAIRSPHFKNRLINDVAQLIPLSLSIPLSVPFSDPSKSTSNVVVVEVADSVSPTVQSRSQSQSGAIFGYFGGGAVSEVPINT